MLLNPVLLWNIDLKIILKFRKVMRELLMKPFLIILIVKNQEATSNRQEGIYGSA